MALQPLSFVFNAAQLYGYNPKRVVLDTIEVDATMSETHAVEADITEHPVEQGANISDHIRQKPRTYTVDGIVTDTPIDSGARARLISALGSISPVVGFAVAGVAAAGALTEQAMFGSVLTKSKEAFWALQAIMDRGVTITIQTPLITYPALAMQSLSITRDPSTGGALHFMASFKEIKTAATKTVAAPPPPPAAQAPADAGGAATKPGSLKLTSSSTALLDLVKKAGSEVGGKVRAGTRVIGGIVAK